MFDRITETFVEIDDYCKLFFPQWEKYLISEGKGSSRGPSPGLEESEIMTILILYHSSNFKHFKNFYNGVILEWLKKYFPGAPSYNRFIALIPRVMVPMTFFLMSKMGKKTGIYYILSLSHYLFLPREKYARG